MIDISKELSEILDVDEEKDKDVIEEIGTLTCKEEFIFLALIAPYYGVKVSPSRVLSASLGVSEEFGVEEAITKIKEQTNCKNLILMINSPGGYVKSSYKMARALRENFEKIIVFVPYEASSGGTLISLVGNEIVMGMMSQLGPIDPSQGDTSALSIKRGFNFVMGELENVEEQDIPYPLKALSDKFSPDEFVSALSGLKMMEEYAQEILELGKMEKNKSKEISKQLVNGFHTHGQVINSAKARDLGLNIARDTMYKNERQVLRKWLAKYLLKGADKHIIRYYIPNECKIGVNRHE
ncbi:hypothetical protein HY449_03905 [Candidatus Pacearchaeota archaeon]|nr:hypothetical protein [Candidatus Pacearchaeota archaeon]